MSRPTHGKQDRERSKKMKAEAKRERRRTAALTKNTPDGEGPDAETRPDPSTTESVLQELDELHRRHSDGEIGDEDFQVAKADLLDRLVVD